ncbi:MAG: heavy metal-binding domain-containing protein [Myxococcales bacterium]|nr:heavy metal-binding domain-containing protein [Myxococcales bacterium]MBL0198358.1 heavy metal-binding domain-containing protein [Myxococcales bacterium]HQY60567.1 heavy metal-binding domain-containing protein [Polyangiaceae bacterium]
MTTSARPVPALSDLSVTEFLTLSRMGFLPHGLVVGASVYEADTSSSGAQIDLWGALFGNAPLVRPVETQEVVALSEAVRAARTLAIERMRMQAAQVMAEGVVGVRLDVEHHLWRGNHQVVKFIAVGTAVGFDREHGPEALRGAPSLRLASGAPFTSDLSGQDFVALLQAGFRPVTVASGTCVYQLNLQEMVRYQGYNCEVAEYTRAFFDARETAMARLQYDLFSWWPAGHPDAPTGIVGMTVSENAHRPQLMGGPARNAVVAGSMAPVVEFTAVGTAIAPLAPGDPRRARQTVKPLVVVPLDR